MFWAVFDTSPPVFTNIINHTNTLNTAFSYDIDATDATGIDSWWVNNTNWSIDSSGVLTNATNLNITLFLWLNVTVNDTAGRENSSIFYINISGVDSTDPTITVGSPTGTYSTSDIWFNVTLNEDGDWCAFDYGSGNLTMTNSSGNWNRLITGIYDGTYSVTFWCNDTSGNMNFTSSSFTISTYVPPTHGGTSVHGSPKKYGNITVNPSSFLLTLLKSRDLTEYSIQRENSILNTSDDLYLVTEYLLCENDESCFWSELELNTTEDLDDISVYLVCNKDESCYWADFITQNGKVDMLNFDLYKSKTEIIYFEVVIPKDSDMVEHEFKIRIDNPDNNQIIDVPYVIIYKEKLDFWMSLFIDLDKILSNYTKLPNGYSIKNLDLVTYSLVAIALVLALTLLYLTVRRSRRFKSEK